MERKNRVRDDYLRARSNAEKEDRRRTILCAAAEIIEEGGLSEDFTIGVLARNSGIAKGTIYLYFETKNEVLAALFEEHVFTWAERMLEECHGEMTETEFTEIFWSCTNSDKLLMKLLVTPLNAGGGAPVSEGRSLEMARERAHILRDLIHLVEDCLELPNGAGWYAITALYAFLIGSAQMDPNFIATMTGQGNPSYHKMFSCEDMFRRNAPGILATSRLLSPNPHHLLTHNLKLVDSTQGGRGTQTTPVE